MNRVSELTQELVNEYARIVQRPLTPEEYLNFRRQAAEELMLGYGVQTLNTHTNIPPTPQIDKGPDPIARPAKTEVVAPVKSTITNTVNTEASPVKNEENEEYEVEDDEDPFFRLIDSLEA